LTVVIRYQDDPDAVWPAQRARQLPPETVATTVTLVPAGIDVRSFAVVEADVRRFAEHSAALVTVAPRTVPGLAIAVTENSNMADSIAVVTNAVTDVRPRRGSAWDKWGTSVAGAQVSPVRTLRTMAPWGQK
jgi:hypothetical protein